MKKIKRNNKQSKKKASEKKKAIVKVKKKKQPEIVKEQVKKKKTGRPRIEFDLAEVEKLGVLHCTESDMAAFFDCSRETICDHMVNDEAFSTAFNKGKGSGNISLRRVQFQRALAGNVKLLIWLGKQYLGQSDKLERTNVELDMSHLSEEELIKEIQELEQA